MTCVKALSDAVLHNAEVVIADKLPDLLDAGLSARASIRSWESEGDYNSELRIEFLRQAALIDVVEDFVIRRGEPVASLEDFRAWVVVMVTAVLDENT